MDEEVIKTKAPNQRTFYSILSPPEASPKLYHVKVKENKKQSKK